MSMKALCLADADYLEGLLASSEADRRRLFSSAATRYRAAMIAWELFELKYYLSDETERQFFPTGYTKDNIESLPPQQIDALTDRVRTFLNGRPNADPDRLEAERYAARAYMRLVRLGAEPKG
jgi:hypothetical protein